MRHVNAYEPTSFSSEITARLRGYIARYDVNQADLAALCDVSQSQFSKIIRGVRPMTIDQLVALCEALDLSVRELVDEVQEWINDRSLQASPVRYVDDGDRLEQPEIIDTEHVTLDRWARASLLRITTAEPTATDVGDPGQDDDAPGRQADYARAARKRSKDRGEGDIDHA